MTMSGLQKYFNMLCGIIKVKMFIFFAYPSTQSELLHFEVRLNIDLKVLPHTHSSKIIFAVHLAETEYGNFALEGHNI